jgi:hypothetical protein
LPRSRRNRPCTDRSIAVCETCVGRNSGCAERAIVSALPLSVRGEGRANSCVMTVLHRAQACANLSLYQHAKKRRPSPLRAGADRTRLCYCGVPGGG